MEKAAAITLILTVLLILLRGKCAGVEVYGTFFPTFYKIFMFSVVVFCQFLSYNVLGFVLKTV